MSTLSVQLPNVSHTLPRNASVKRRRARATFAESSVALRQVCVTRAEPGLCCTGKSAPASVGKVYVVFAAFRSSRYGWRPCGGQLVASGFEAISTNGYELHNAVTRARQSRRLLWHGS
jgi:hypothetical protein